MNTFQKYLNFTFSNYFIQRWRIHIKLIPAHSIVFYRELIILTEMSNFFSSISKNKLIYKFYKRLIHQNKYNEKKQRQDCC